MYGKVVLRWQHAGLACQIRTATHSLDGFVRLPDDHPDRYVSEAAHIVSQAEVEGHPFGSTASTGHRYIPVDVHGGGLTSGPDNDGWVGSIQITVWTIGIGKNYSPISEKRICWSPIQ